MPQFIPLKSQSEPEVPAPRESRCLVRVGESPPQVVQLRQFPVLLGSAAICDLRLPDFVCPPVLAVLQANGAELSVRRLVEDPKPTRTGSFEPLTRIAARDVVQIGPCRLEFDLHLSDSPTAAPPVKASITGLAAEAQKLAESRQQFEDERRDWEQEAERQAEDLALRTRQLLEREKELERQVRELATRPAAVAGSGEALRQELGHLRDQLYERFHRRHEQLATMKRAVRRAGSRVQEKQRSLALQEAETRARLSSLAEQETKAQAQFKLVEDWQKELEGELHAREAKLDERQAALAEQETELATRVAQVEARAQVLERLPEHEEKVADLVARLDAARGQFRSELEEVNAFAQSSQQDLLALRGQLAEQEAKLRTGVEELTKERQAHRLEVGRFKLFLADWQTQWQKFRDLIQKDQVELRQREQNLVREAERLRQDSSQLEIRLEELAGREQEVGEQRATLNRHLTELQAWHQQKQQQLAQEQLLEVSTAGPTILPFVPGLTEADQKLSRLLVEHQLVPPPMLAKFQDAARRARTTLRNVLLSGGHLTAFQLDKIEAGQFKELLVGRVRLLDLIRQSNVETIYRVFDPEQKGEALLRVLGANCPADRQAEFREGFLGACQVKSSHVAATLAVFDTPTGPAVLQEWPKGLPSGDWKKFASSAKVWLKLLRQGTEGLAAIHAAGQVHGRLLAGRLMLTLEGTLKLCGLGEPPWLLSEAAYPVRPPTAADDLQALARIAQGWLVAPAAKLTGRTGNETLTSLLKRFEDPQTRAPLLLQFIDAVDRQTEGDEGDWQRLMQFVRAKLSPSTPARNAA